MRGRPTRHRGKGRGPTTETHSLMAGLQGEGVIRSVPSTLSVMAASRQVGRREGGQASWCAWTKTTRYTTQSNHTRRAPARTGDEETKEPVRRDEGHREREIAQVVGGGRQM